MAHAGAGCHCHQRARVWPAQDYTRLTIESKQAIRHNMFTIKNPDRLVIDLEDVEIGAALNDLTEKIGNDDPYIKKRCASAVSSPA